MLGRLVLIAGWTVIAMPIQSVMLLLPGRGKEWFAQVYWRGIAMVLGLRMTVRGRVGRERPALYVVNHCSWLDIVVLGAVLPGCFVAKAAIRNWPFINWIALLGRTVFVSRARSRVGQEGETLIGRLAEGDNIILFPEGTTSDGVRVMPFSSSFLALAGAASRPHVQAVTMVYDRLDNLPVRRVDRPLIAWYGDMDLASHFNGIGRHRRLHATIILDQPIPPGMFPHRKALTAALEARLAANAAALRQGRPVKTGDAGFAERLMAPYQSGQAGAG